MVDVLAKDSSGPVEKPPLRSQDIVLEQWIITFGYGDGQKPFGPNGFYRFNFKGNRDDATKAAYEKFGNRWSNIYSSEAAAGVGAHDLVEVTDTDIAMAEAHGFPHLFDQEAWEAMGV